MTRTALQRGGVPFFALLALILACASAASATSKYKVLYSFKGGADGGDTRGTVVFDRAGNLYGTTLGGGVNGVGAVFQLAPKPEGLWTETVPCAPRASVRVFVVLKWEPRQMRGSVAPRCSLSPGQLAINRRYTHRPTVKTCNRLLTSLEKSWG